MPIIHSEVGTSDGSTHIYRLNDCNVPCNHTHDGSLCGVCSAIADVGSQINALHSRLEELYEKHRTLRTKRNDFSNISKLPHDVAFHIFILCLPPIDQVFHGDFGSPCSSFLTPSLPLRLSAVCHSWRRLAHSIPRLWSTLEIDVSQPNLQHISHRLQWSGTAPLRVGLRASGLSTSPQMILLVKQNLPRMAQLCLRLPFQIIKTIFSGVRNALPILEDFHIHSSTSGRREVSTIHNLVLSDDPPSPHKVFLNSHFITNIPLNWSNVRHLSLEATEGIYPLIADAFTLLSEGKRLHVVDFISYFEYQVPPTGIMVVQNSIRNLRLFYTSETILSHTTMPYLESLTLWQSHSEPDTDLLSFLQRSACSLKTMVWKPWGTYLRPEFNDIFRFTPKLQQLSLNLTAHEELENDLLPFLGRLADVIPHGVESAEHRNALLPLLQRFCYAGKTTHALPSLFLDIAEHRSSTSQGGQVIQPLEELIVCRYQIDDDFEPPTGSDLQRLLRLNSTGQKISVLEYNHLHCEMSDIDFSACYPDDP